MNKLLSRHAFTAMVALYLTVLFCAPITSDALTRRVLYIGNSYIFTNNVPLLVDSLCQAHGDTIIYDQNLIGGYTLNQHSTNATTIAKIFSQHWDIVIVQEQSQMPSFPPSQVATDVYPYATRLDSMVRANDSCSQTMFLMTWGRANGDASNCPSYPPLCTYNGMQLRLRESYMQMGQTNRALVAPVGMAFKVFKDSVYSPLLFSPDSSHPSLAGSYLEACVLYSSIFHKKNLNCSYISTVPASDASRIQRIADKVTFDSLFYWQGYGHYPYAGFTYTAGGATATFTQQSPVAASHSWSFGDATTDTARNPSHHYTSSGRFLITHTVSNNCFVETYSDSVFISTTGIIEQTVHNEVTVMTATQGQVTIRVATGTTGTLEVMDIQGRKVASLTAATSDNTIQLQPGVYVYRFYNSTGAITNGRFAAY